MHSTEPTSFHPVFPQRRHAGESAIDAPLKFLDLELAWTAHRVLKNGRALSLSTLHVRLLRFLMQWPTRVFTRSEILEHVWPQGVFVSERTVDVHMSLLRRAPHVAGHPDLLRTVRGRGYSLDLSNPEEAAAASLSPLQSD
jgi:two-component system phosphate regulon response regulator PhoB